MKIQIACFVMFVAATAALLGAADLKPTRTSFLSSSREVIVGTSLTLKAVVVAVTPDEGVPAGTVEFVDGATSLGTAQLAAVEGRAEATFFVTLDVGPHPITIRYGGDGTFGGSVSLPEFVLVLAE
jgi:hypothetical protein